MTGGGRSQSGINWARHEIALHALRSTAAVLRSRGVPVIPIKGIALAYWVYQDVSQRAFDDVDLLVSRSAWPEAQSALLSMGEPNYRSDELGELSVPVHGMAIEIHAEIGRLDLTEMTVDQVLTRATPDETTFGFPILRIDDVDHLLIVAMNALKDGFACARPHIHHDLERYIEIVFARRADLVSRARAASFATGLYCVAEWMHEEHGSTRWAEILAMLTPPPRPLYASTVRAFRRSELATLDLAVVLSCWANDRRARRLASLSRIARRRTGKWLGRQPP